MSKVPDYIKENIYRAVKRDIEPGRLVVHAKVGASVVLGGSLSLFLCGQMGLGLSPFAMRVHTLLMHYGGFWGCTVLCGVIFAVLPVILLKMLSSGVQYLVLLRRQRGVIAGWVLAFGAYLVFLNQQQSDVLLRLISWGTPAVFSFYVFGRLFHFFTHVSHWQQREGAS